MSYLRDWNESTPVDHSTFDSQPEAVRNTKIDVAERLKNILYGFVAGETDEGIKYLPFKVQTTDPTPTTDKAQIYSKDVNGVAELFLMDESGNIIQLTNGGYLKLNSGKLLNDTFLVGRNAAGTGDINIIKVNTSDIIELGAVTQLPDTSKLATSAAPTADEEIANKKYVDDQIAANAVSLGAWNSGYVAGTSYLAATDGFVCAFAGDQAGIEATLYGYTDSSNPPATTRNLLTFTKWGTITFPVKAGDYWKVVNTGTTTTTIYFIPLS